MPLDTRSLSHTSKEPEAQVWAQIGTSSYDPPVPKSESNESSATSPSLTKYHIPKLSQKGDEEDGTTSEVELHVDETAEPLGTENEAETLAKTESSAESQEDESNGDTKASEDDDEEEEKEDPPKRERSRSRSRSPKERNLKADDPHTNSSDPKMVKSRIFVGHLNTDKATKKDVEKIFSRFGNIIGITLQNGYGFVQFDNEESARIALKDAQGIPLLGSKLGK